MIISSKLDLDRSMALNVREGHAFAGSPCPTPTDSRGSSDAFLTFRPTVLAVQPARELRWLGRFLIPGLFDGEHQFEIHPLGPGRVRFVQQERFTGVLVPLLARNLDDHTLRGFNAMNAALKARAEAAVGNQPVVAA
jgi:hypothetical protein